MLPVSFIRTCDMRYGTWTNLKHFAKRSLSNGLQQLEVIYRQLWALFQRLGRRNDLFDRLFFLFQNDRLARYEYTMPSTFDDEQPIQKRLLIPSTESPPFLSFEVVIWVHQFVCAALAAARRQQETVVVSNKQQHNAEPHPIATSPRPFR